MDRELSINITAHTDISAAAQAANAVRAFAGNVRDAASVVRGASSSIGDGYAQALSRVDNASDAAGRSTRSMGATIRDALRDTVRGAREFALGFGEGMRDAVREAQQAERKSKAALDGMGNASKKNTGGSLVAGAVGGFAAGFAVEGAQALKGFAASTLSTADGIGDFAQRLGVTTDAVQTLSGVFVANGGSPELMETALDKLNQGLGAFTLTGGGPAANAFKRLGIDAQISSGAVKGTEQTFYAITKALEGVTDPAERARLSTELFGRGAGNDMVEVLSAGSAAMIAQRDEMVRLGLVMDSELIAKTAQAKLELDKSSFAFKQMATIGMASAIVGLRDIAATFAPLNAKLSETGKKLGPEFSAAGALLGTTAKQIGAALLPLFSALVDVGAAILKAVGPTAMAIFKAAGPIVVGVAGVITNVVQAVAAILNGDWSMAFIASAKAVWSAVGVIKSAFGGLGGVFIAVIRSYLGYVYTGFASISAGMMQVGRDIVDGLVRGIRAKIGEAKQAARDMAAQVAAGAKSFLGIASPSKLFEVYGRNTVEGYIKGLLQSTSDAREAFKQALSGVIESLMTESERAAIKASQDAQILAEAHRQGALSADQYAQAMDRLYAAQMRSKIADGVNPNIPTTNAPDIDGSKVPTLSIPQGDGNTAATGWRKAWQDSIGAVKTSMGSLFANFITGAQSWRETLGGLLNQVVGLFANAAADMLMKYILSQTGQTTAAATGAAARGAIETGAAGVSLATTGTTALASIGASAAQAFGSAYAAIAGIPIVGPFLAPAVAAAAFTGVMAIGSKVFSARGGAENVPYDGMPFELHREEMVLPSWMAKPFRDTLQAARGARTGQTGMITQRVTGQAVAANENRQADLMDMLIQSGGNRSSQVNISAVDARSISRLLERGAPATKRGLGRLARDMA